MEYIIREIKDEEIDEANKLLNKLIIDEKEYDNNINENYIVKDYYQNRAKNSIIFVATHEEKIIAYVYGYIVDMSVYLEKKAILDALFVENEHRGNRVANLLINNFKQWSFNQGVQNIELTVCADNVEALELYKKQGFNVKKYTMSL